MAARLRIMPCLSPLGRPGSNALHPCATDWPRFTFESGLEQEELLVSIMSSGPDTLADEDKHGDAWVDVEQGSARATRSSLASLSGADGLVYRETKAAARKAPPRNRFSRMLANRFKKK